LKSEGSKVTIPRMGREIEIDAEMIDLVASEPYHWYMANVVLKGFTAKEMADQVRAQKDRNPGLEFHYYDQV